MAYCVPLGIILDIKVMPLLQAFLVPLDSFVELLNDNAMMQILGSYFLEYLIKRIVIFVKSSHVLWFVLLGRRRRVLLFESVTA